MTKEVLHQKMQTNSNYSMLKKEIDQSVDIGEYVSVSPRYTFINMDSGCKFIKNTHIVRFFIETTRSGRHCSFFSVFQYKDQCGDQWEIKLHSYQAVDMLQLRTAYDAFCPGVLTGTEGNELTLEEIRLIQNRRKSLIVPVIWASILPFCGMAAFYLCEQQHMYNLGVFILVATLIASIAILTISLGSLLKYEKSIINKNT